MNNPTRMKFAPNWQLTVDTHKSHTGKLLTHVSVNRGNIHRLYADYSEFPEANKVRCTQKAIETQHTRAMSNLPQIIDQVREHYTKRGEEFGDAVC
jgi:hypothetical protein